jgi:Flp pilus assembly protein TadG
MISAFKNFILSWARRDDGVAAVEAALIFPIMLTLLMGTYDLGNAILANQKTIRASQVVGDLVTRERSIDDQGIDDAIDAAELALVPMPPEGLGIDIVSISFDENEQATIEWRETRGMTADPDVLNRVAGLAAPNEGVVVVLVRYNFLPIFANFVTGEIAMEEVAFTRGRKSAVVTRT